MLAAIGEIALAAAVCVCVLQVLFAVRAARGPAGSLDHGLLRGMVSAQLALILVTYVALSLLFARDAYAVQFVAENSHADLPLIYKLTAVWGGHEGSLLLWMTMLAGWTWVVAHRSARLPAHTAATVLGVLGFVSLGFLTFTLWTSNPFDLQFPAPRDGQDLNPLLQDPGMVIHPPLLYMGYVGFAVAFAFAVTALIEGRLDSEWARWTRPWTTAAWSFLTAGIALGSWWAYHELGWGGWWFWDPVENASFMPWLVGTALIHSLAATEKRDVFKSWTVLLAIAAFGLSLLGTFLVRSGVLTSVHAFATDPARGVFILAFLGIIVGGALALYAWRGPGTLRGADYALTSRETFLLANSVLLSVATATVLLGTLYPLALDALGLGKISVGPPYFNAVFVPLMAPLLVLVGLGQEAHWRRDHLARLARPLRYPLIGTLVFVTGAVLMLDPGHRLEAWLGLALATWVVAATAGAVVARCRARRQPLTALFSLPPAFLGQCLAHVGFAVTVVGVTLVSLYGVDKHVRMGVGDVAELAGVQFEFVGSRELEGPNYTGTAARFAVRRDGVLLTELEAEKRLYTVRGMPMTEAGIAPGLTRDLYVALGESLEDGSWSVRLSAKPFVRWLWLGALLMASGALLATRDPRFRRARARHPARLADGADANSARG